MAELYPTTVPKTIPEMAKQEGIPYVSDFLQHQLSGYYRDKIERPKVLYKNTYYGGIVPLRVAKVLEARWVSGDVYSSLCWVSEDIKCFPELTIPRIFERLQKYQNFVIPEDEKMFQVRVIRRTLESLRPADILSEFSDTEIAMLYFRSHYQSQNQHFEEYLKCKYYYLEKMRDHIRRMAWYDAQDDWNLSIDLLQKMMKFELQPFEVKVEGSVAWIKWWSVFYRDENGEKVFFDAGLRFLCFYKGKRVLTISFEYHKDNKLRIRQIQWAKWARRELMKVWSYPEDILKAFIEQFPGYEIYFIGWENAMQNALSAYSVCHLKDNKDWYYTHQATTKFIHGDANRIVAFYNQDFPSLEVWSVENGFRKVSLKTPQKETI